MENVCTGYVVSLSFVGYQGEFLIGFLLIPLTSAFLLNIAQCNATKERWVEFLVCSNMHDLCS